MALMGNRSSARSDLYRTMTLRRITRALLLGAVAAIAGLGAGTAAADPPRPTDYRSRIVSITPATSNIEVRIVGGDSFIELAADDGVEVIVEGYDGEPYLRFLADGGVEENQRSPAHWLNNSRYATTPAPPEADPTAVPQWKHVASGHTWSWHDHRTHWMSSVRPMGLRPGDQVLDQVVPLTVDGRRVEVAVVSILVAEPSTWPSVLSALGCVVLLVAVARVARHRATAVAVMAVALSSSALVVGAWQTLSLPGSTGPPITAWALPATALVFAAASSIAGITRRWSSFTRHALVVVCGAQLVVWLVVRCAVLTHPVLPTSAPFWFDRSVTAAVGATASALIVIATRALFAQPTRS
jgi:hypothetical protein